MTKDQIAEELKQQPRYIRYLALTAREKMCSATDFQAGIKIAVLSIQYPQHLADIYNLFQKN